MTKSITKIIAICLLCAFACGVVSAAETTASDSNAARDQNIQIKMLSDFGVSNEAYYWGVGFTKIDSNGHRTLKVTKNADGKKIGKISEIKAVIPGSYFTIPDDEKPEARLYIETIRRYGPSHYCYRYDYIGLDITSLIKKPDGQISKKIIITLLDKLDKQPITKADAIEIRGRDGSMLSKMKTLFYLPATMHTGTYYHDWWPDDC